MGVTGQRKGSKIEYIKEGYTEGLTRQGSFTTKGMLLQNVSARCVDAAARLHRPLAACCQRLPLACTAPLVLACHAALSLAAQTRRQHPPTAQSCSKFDYSKAS